MWEERESERERQQVRERGEGGGISGGEDARSECVADRGTERETSRCTADGKQQESSQTAESVNEREGSSSRRRESREIHSLKREEGSDSPIPPPLVAVWTPDESKFAVGLLAGLQPGQMTRCAFATWLIGVAPRSPAGDGYVICFGVRM